ncbi:DUF4180 domain-containing protein [Actinokineospora enzanensis]|uniref:DUF4180 domain-containing protein n=1 Tax=Actinokineospora enzanensis TaxID=155975 RepID=UPI0003694E9E|nr:DUF4180 domain-containing protein [Actinokineospora enzanensis]
MTDQHTIAPGQFPAAEDLVAEVAGQTVLYYPVDGPALSTEQDALDVIGAAWGARATVVALPAGRMAPEFFELRTRVLGAFIAKFVNYQVPLAVVGDFGAHLAASESLRAFTYETNRGRQFWLLDSLDDLHTKLR